MNTVYRCPQCGGPLSSGDAQGLCPKCLLNLGVASHASYASASTGGMSAASGRPLDPPPTSAYGTAFDAPSPEALSQLFPQLEIVELLGQGGMGAVYKARQPKLDRCVAVKILPREIARSTAFADRFGREARALAQLSHPNIVTVYDFGETDGLFYFLMEYIDGTDLRQLVASRQLSPESALAIVPQVCDALQFAHSEGIVHRDIKPENILVDKRGRVKIADFGLAKLLGTDANRAQNLTATDQVMGTPRYMAPEQIERPQLVDHRADIYALGVVLYEMLTGELPLGRFAPPSAKVQVDVRLDEVVFRALEKEPERRYQHASEVKTAVERIAVPASAQRAAEREPDVPDARDDDFVICNPRLPKIAQWICIYALVISPVLYALSFASMVAFTFNENDYVIVSEVLTLPFSLLTLVVLLIGGFKLRALRRGALGWLKAGFVIEMVWVPIYVAFWLVWFVSDPAAYAAFDQPGNGRDFVGLTLLMLCYGFDLFALIWLMRHGRALPLA